VASGSRTSSGASPRFSKNKENKLVLLHRWPLHLPTPVPPLPAPTLPLPTPFPTTAPRQTLLGTGDHPSILPACACWKLPPRYPGSSLHQGGRSKSQRWSDTHHNSSPGGSCLSPYSYKKALLSSSKRDTTSTRISPPPATSARSSSAAKAGFCVIPEVQSRPGGSSAVYTIPIEAPLWISEESVINCFSSHLAAACSSNSVLQVSQAWPQGWPMSCTF
jgi:hypothetical protein